MVHHVEHGSCPNARFLSHDDIYRFVRSTEPSGLISKKLIGWKGGDDQYEATYRAWNGDAWECYRYLPQDIH